MAKSRKRRKRRGAVARKAAAPVTPPSGPTPGRGAAPIEERRPPAPWGSFPLVELMVLLGLGLLVAGFLVGGQRGTSLLVAGLAIASLAGLELSIREHFGGYRSHSLLLAGAIGLATLLAAHYLAGIPPATSVIIGAAAAVPAFWALAAAFRRRSGRLVKLR